MNDVLNTGSDVSVHGELVEPYAYARTCHPELEVLGVAGVMQAVYFRNQRKVV